MLSSTKSLQRKKFYAENNSINCFLLKSVSRANAPLKICNPYQLKAMRQTVERSDWAATEWVRVCAAAFSCDTDSSMSQFWVLNQWCLHVINGNVNWILIIPFDYIGTLFVQYSKLWRSRKMVNPIIYSMKNTSRIDFQNSWNRIVVQ